MIEGSREVAASPETLTVTLVHDIEPLRDAFSSL